MKISPRVRPEKACSTDSTRINFTQPYLDLSVPAEPRLVALNGHMLISIPVIPGPDDAGP